MLMNKESLKQFIILTLISNTYACNRNSYKRLLDKRTWEDKLFNSRHSNRFIVVGRLRTYSSEVPNELLRRLIALKAI